MDELERLSGLDRWTLARQFRAALGTSLTGSAPCGNWIMSATC